MVQKSAYVRNFFQKIAEAPTNKINPAGTQLPPAAYAERLCRSTALDTYPT